MLSIVARLSLRARTMPRRSPLTSVTPALSMATSVPVPIAIPTWAWARLRPFWRGRQATRAVDRRTDDAGAGHLFDRDRLPRDHRFVHGALAFEDHTVHGH